MDTVIVATALPAIPHDLNAWSSEAYWAGSGFLFAQAVSQPLYGAMSSVFGRTSCLMFIMVVFTVSSIVCAVARNMTWLVAARVVLDPEESDAVGSMIITNMVSLHERGKFIGILSLASALGLIGGILMGAAIAGWSS